MSGEIGILEIVRTWGGGGIWFVGGEIFVYFLLLLRKFFTFMITLLIFGLMLDHELLNKPALFIELIFYCFKKFHYNKHVNFFH